MKRTVHGNYQKWQFCNHSVENFRNSPLRTQINRWRDYRSSKTAILTILESVLFNLTECIFVFRTVRPKKSGKFQSLLNKKWMTVLKTKIHFVRLKSTNSRSSGFWLLMNLVIYIDLILTKIEIQSLKNSIKWLF